MPPKGKRHGKGKPQTKNNQSHRETTAAAAAHIIPHEVLSGILSRLPAKSLLRFKCVSKQWRTLISLPSFISAHLSHAPSSLLIHNHCVLGGGGNQPNPGDGDDCQFVHGLYSYKPLNPSTKTGSSIETIDDFPGSGVVPFDYNMEVIGSTPNGIVCIAQKPFAEILTLWNPATRFTRSIRAPKLKANWKHHEGVSIGIGYDPSRNDIKIVRILCSKEFMTPPDKVEFYSLKSGAWTILDMDKITPFGVRAFKCDFVFEGVPYWRCLVNEPRVLDRVHMLISFLPEKSVIDMEDFGMYLKDKNTPVRMGEIHGCLAAVSWEVLGRGKDSSQMLDVWLRYKKVGWKKLYRVGPLPVIGRVLGLYGERGVVQESEDDGNLYMFDFKKKVVEDRVHSLIAVVPKSYMMLSYKESLTRIPEPGRSII